MKVVIAVVYILALLAQPYASLGMTVSSFKSMRQHLSTVSKTKMRNPHVLQFVELSQRCLESGSEEACDNDAELLSAAAYAIEYTSSDDLSARTIKPLLKLVILGVQQYAEHTDTSKLESLVESVGDESDFNAEEILEALKHTFGEVQRSSRHEHVVVEEEEVSRSNEVERPEEQVDTRRSSHHHVVVGKEEAAPGSSEVERVEAHAGKRVTERQQKKESDERSARGVEDMASAGPRGTRQTRRAVLSSRQDEKEQDTGNVGSLSKPDDVLETPTSTRPSSAVMERGAETEREDADEQEEEPPTELQEVLLLEESAQLRGGEQDDWFTYILSLCGLPLGITVVLILIVYYYFKGPPRILKPTEKKKTIIQNKDEMETQEIIITKTANLHDIVQDVQDVQNVKQKVDQKVDQKELLQKQREAEARIELLEQVAEVAKLLKKNMKEETIVPDVKLVAVLRNVYDNPNLKKFAECSSILDWISRVRDFFQGRDDLTGCDSEAFSNPGEYVGIVGAGVAGLTAALHALREGGKPVKIIEKAPGFTYSHILSLTHNSFGSAGIYGMLPLMKVLLPDKQVEDFMNEFLHGMYDSSKIKLAHKRLCAFLALSLLAAGGCIRFNSAFVPEMTTFDSQSLPNVLVLATSSRGARIVQSMYNKVRGDRHAKLGSRFGANAWDEVNAGLVHNPYHIVVAVEPTSLCKKAAELVSPKDDGKTCHLEISFVVGQGTDFDTCHGITKDDIIDTKKCISRLVPEAARERLQPLRDSLEYFDKLICQKNLNIMEAKCWKDRFRVLWDVEKPHEAPLLSFFDDQAERHVLLVGDLVRDAIPDGAMGANDAHDMGRAAGQCVADDNPADCYDNKMKTHETDVIKAINEKAASEYRGGFLRQLISLLG
eukprot:GILJ01006452.1.p1 GENE.GILJ01006452.1~~GILJ01006452.1.p1  ORF type:complete len:889 (+),score=137.71 GILJ01006452.1:44-2710(+)